MTDPTQLPRLFTDAGAIVRIGEGLLSMRLPRADWTHEAHLAATCWLVACRPDLDLETELPGIIRAYNESVGGVNDDHQGYHETLTQLYLAGVRAHLADEGGETDLLLLVNRLIESPRGHRDWPLHFYSRQHLFSVAARRYFVAPDRCPFSDAPAGWHCHPRQRPRAMEEQHYGNA